MGNKNITPGLEMYNNQSGETYGVITYPKDVEEHYTLRRLKMNTWINAYNWVLEKVCNSNKDITFIRMLTEITNRENQVVGSLARLSQESGLSRTKVSGLLNKLVKIGFLAKESTSVYQINPYVYIGNKAHITSRTSKAMLQVEWSKKYGYPPEPDELQESTTLLKEKR